MTGYVARRCVQMAIALFGLTVLLFILFKVEAVGPCTAFLLDPTPAGAASYHACVVSYGLDQPVPLQYLRWLALILRGDFGIDNMGQPVLGIILTRLPATLILVGSSYLLQEVIALPLGIAAALRRYSAFDRLLGIGAYVGLSLPTFWLGAIVVLIFAVRLGWAPPGGMVTTVSHDPVVAGIPAFGTGAYWHYVLIHPLATLGDLLAHLALPALTLAIAGIAVDSQYMRGSMLTALDSDYVLTARAKGVSPARVVAKHALRNALPPLITNAGLFIPTLIGGAVVVETVFGWAGIGKYFIDAVRSGDNNPVIAILILSGLATLVGSLVADILYGVADPRLRYD